jgi:TP901 family phage tail tape measure protein
LNNVQLNIVANAQFQQVYAEVAKLKEAMLSLQKASVGGPFTSANVAGIKQAQTAFDNAVLSTRAFNIESVAMSSSIEKFGKQLSAGKLSLSQYYKIWRDSAKGTSKELDALATSQARLNRSIAIADPLRPGYAKLVTDINGVVTAQEKQMFYQKALNTALNEGSVKLINFGKNTQWMGRQLTVGLTMPLAMFGAGISSAFLTVDKELTRMQKVYGTGLVQPTQQALKQIRTDVQVLGTELAKTMGSSVKDTAAMAANLAATGLQGANLLSSTREAMRLATLGELDHQEAMMATVSLQNVYKLSTQGLSEAVNFLNAVENQTSTSLQDLVDAIPRVGPIVKQLGGSFKDTAAMMVAMKEAGVPAAQGANAIKSALASLINPTKAAREEFAKYNINIGNMAKVTNGNPIMMLKVLANEMKNLDKISQAQLIEKMFGKYQFARVQALIDNINKSGSQTETVFGLMGASATELGTLASNELKTMTESASGRFKRMVEGLKADLLPMGNMFLESFTRIGNAVNKILNAFQSLGQVLGPVSKILGPLLGTGIAGLIVVGPIIMLIGLFSNLIGNILRSANSIRMFKQGMDAALPSENKFMAGLHGMRNFYETLDKSTIAARNQMELMPEAITSNARAFDILSKSILDLTMQFQSLTVAQSEAMGLGAIGKGGKAGPRPFTIPFRAPGHIDGAVGLTGGVPGKDSIPAMLAPGESVLTAEATAKYGSLFPAMNAGTLPGFMSGYLPARSHASNPFSKDSPQFMAGIQQAGLEKLYAEFPDFIKVVSNLVVELPQQLNVAMVRGKASIEEFSTAWSERSGKMLLSAKLGGADISDPTTKSAVAKLESEIGQRTIALAKGTANQTVSDELLAKATNEVIVKYKDLATAEGKAAQALYQSSQQIGQVRTQFPTESIRSGLASGQFTQVGRNVMYGDTQIARTKNALTKDGQLSFRPASAFNTPGNYGKQSLQGSQIASESAMAAQKILAQVSAGAQQGIRTAAQMHSPAQTEIMMGKNLVDSLNTGIESRKGQSIIAGEKLGDAVNKGVKSRFSLSNMGFMAKSTIGMGAMIGGSALGGAVGGTSGSAISGAASFGSMALMMGAGGGLTAAVTALGAALPILTNAFKTLSDNIRIEANQLKGSLSLSSAAVSYFNIKFTPLANYDFSKITDDFGKHVKSIKDNKAAVDQLTQAYLSATDQMTKDLVKGLSKDEYKDQQKTVERQYLTNIASGMTKDQALQNVTALMSSAGMGILSQQSVRGSLNKYSKYDPSQASSALLNQLATESANKPIRAYPSGRGAAVVPTEDMKRIKDKTYLTSEALQGTLSILRTMSEVSSKAFDDATGKLDINRKTLLSTNQVYDAFAKLVADGDTKMIKFTGAFRLAGGSTVQLQQAIRLINAGLMTQDQILGNIVDRKFDSTWPEMLKKLIEMEKATGVTDIPGLGGAGTTPVDHSKEYSPLLKHLNAVQKLIQSQADAQKKYNDQLKATQDYQLKQMDYYNQMKNAFTSGNFLGAAMLKDSAKAAQADFAGTIKEQKNQNLLSNIQNLISTVQEASTGGDSFAKWKKANPGLAKFTSSKYDSALLGGVSQPTWSKNTSSIISKANQAQDQASAAVAGGPFQNLVINVSADNSVIPEQFGQNLSQQIQAAIQKAYVKNQTSNKVNASSKAKGTKVK